MLAARDQENRVFAHQAGGAAKQQNLQKTPGARFPKTPLKVPLNDENAARTFGGKTGLVERPNGGNENLRTVGRGAKATGKANLATPLVLQTNRAPLGNKTTNAKARTGQVGGVKGMVKEIENTQTHPATARRQAIRSPQLDSLKLGIHSDTHNGPDVEDVEYVAPPPAEEPYKSDIFSADALTFDAFKPENRLRGYYNYYYNPVDENGISLREKQRAEQRQKAFDDTDKQITQDMEEFDWSVDDVPASKDFLETRKKQKAAASAAKMAPAARAVSRLASKPLSTVAARKAASALSLPSKAPTALQPKAAKPLNTRSALTFLGGKKKIPEVREKECTTGVVASRTTIGYNKGRTASSLEHTQSAMTLKPPRTLNRTASAVSSGSDTTITPSRFAQRQAAKSAGNEDWRRLEFLSIFDGEEDEDENVRDPEDIIVEALDDDDFQLPVPS